jgi:hypothetical protein
MGITPVSLVAAGKERIFKAGVGSVAGVDGTA